MHEETPGWDRSRQIRREFIPLSMAPAIFGLRAGLPQDFQYR
jgi:hypothetical protein